MNRRELRRWLVSLGAISIHTGKHEVFLLNTTRIAIPTSGKELNWRLEKMIKIQVRDALKISETVE